MRMHEQTLHLSRAKILFLFLISELNCVVIIETVRPVPRKLTRGERVSFTSVHPRIFSAKLFLRISMRTNKRER